MPGILDRTQGDPRQAQNDTQVPGKPPTEGPSEGEGTATPEEQESYEKVVLAAMQILYKDGKENIMKQIKNGAGQPGQTIGKIAANLVIQIDNAANGDIPEVVIIPAAAEILELVAEFAEEAGGIKVTDNVIGRALQQMIQTVAEKYGVEPEEVQALIDTMPESEREGMIAEQEAYAGSEEVLPSGKPPAATNQPPQGVQ